MPSKPRHFEAALPDITDGVAMKGLDLHCQQHAVELLTELVRVTEQGRADVDGPGVYTGAAGIALTLLHAAQLQPGKAAAKAHLLSARSIINGCLAALVRERPNPTFLTGSGGVFAMAAAVAHHAGDAAAAQQYASQLVTMGHSRLLSSPSLPDELLYGRAGFLWACLFVERQLQSPPCGTGSATSGGSASSSSGQPAQAAAPAQLSSHPVPFRRIPRSLVVSVLAELLQRGRHGAAAAGSECPLMFHWHDTPYLGAAHGLTGICHVALETLAALACDNRASTAGSTASASASAAAGPPLLEPTGGSTPSGSSITVDLDAASRDVHGTLAYLLSVRHPSGNLPSHDGSSADRDRLVQWCHGAPGLALTLVRAWELYPLTMPQPAPTTDEDEGEHMAHILGSGGSAAPAVGGVLLPREAYASAAVAAGEVVWSRGLLRKLSCCHGIAGNLYAFLALRRLALAQAALPKADTTDTAAASSSAASSGAEVAAGLDPGLWLHRARCFAYFLLHGPMGPSSQAQAAVINAGSAGPSAASSGNSSREQPYWQRAVAAGVLHGGDRSDSLMEGAAGVVYALLDVATPEAADFPAYELPLMLAASC